MRLTRRMFFIFVYDLKVVGKSSSQFIAISAGAYHTYALRTQEGVADGGKCFSLLWIKVI